MTSTFPLPSGAVLSTRAGLGPVLGLETARGRASIALHGATVLSFRPAGAEHDLFWLSSKAAAAAGKAVRGGIPLCGPWFGPHATVASAPTHGLMRTRAWNLVRVEVAADDGLRAEFSLDLPADKAAGWPHQARAGFSITVGSSLRVELDVRNTGRAPFLLSGALHTYFAVSDVRDVFVEGLAEREYLDFTGGGVRRWHGGGPIVLREEAAHMFYSGTPVRLVDRAWNRAIHLRGWGAAATVVWNPWERTAGTMTDVGADWPRFLCVENANIPDVAVPLPPDMSHHLGAEIAATPL